MFYNLKGTAQSIFFNTVVVLVFALVCSIYPPLFIFGLLLIFFVTGERKLLLFYVVSILVFFIYVNYNREIFTPGNDLIWYSIYWKVYASYDMGFLSIFNGDIYKVVPRATEPVFHFLSYALSRLSNANYLVFVAWILSVIYIIPCYIFFKVVKPVDNSSYLIALLCTFQLLMLYDFSNSFNLLRQYFAMSLLLLCFYYSYKKEFGLMLVWGVLSVLSHSSSAIFVLLFGFLYLFNAGYIKNKLLLIALFFVFSFLFMFIVLSIDSHYEELEETGRGMALKLIDFSVFVFATFVVFYKSKKYSFLWYYYFSVVVVIGFSHLSSYLPLRYFAYLDSFKWIGYLIIIDYMFGRFVCRKEFFVLLVFVPFLYFVLKFNVSTFVFNDDIVGFVLSSPYENFINNDLRL